MTRRSQVILGSIAILALTTSALGIAFNSTHSDSWASIDAFKQGLPGKLKSSLGAAPNFDLVRLGEELSQFRVEGMPVCASDEVSADQYIELSDIAGKLSAYGALTLQLNSILESPSGISDCQFRILQWAAL